MVDEYMVVIMVLNEQIYLLLIDDHGFEWRIVESCLIMVRNGEVWLVLIADG